MSDAKTNRNRVRKLVVAVLAGVLAPAAVAPAAAGESVYERSLRQRTPVRAEAVARQEVDLELYAEVAGDRSEPVEARIKACQVLAAAGRRAVAAGAVPVLAKVVERKELDVVHHPAQNIFGDDRPYAPAWTEDRGLKLRTAALTALERIGPEAGAAALPSLLKALDGIEGAPASGGPANGPRYVVDREFYEALVNVLATFGEAAKEAAPTLRGIMLGTVNFDEDGDHLDAPRLPPVVTGDAVALRVAAARALGRVAPAGDQATIKALRRAKSQLEGHLAVREAAAEAFEAMTAKRGN